MEKTLTLAQKIELARWIQKVNGAGMLLTGSLMLYLRDIDLGREPQDIDFIIAKGTSPEDIIMPPFIEKISVICKSPYPVAARYMYHGTKIEFLCAPLSEFENFDELVLFSRADDRFFPRLDGIYLASVDGLLAAKKEYVANDTSEESKEKHRRDIEIIEKWLTDKNK